MHAVEEVSTHHGSCLKVWEQSSIVKLNLAALRENTDAIRIIGTMLGTEVPCYAGMDAVMKSGRSWLKNKTPPSTQRMVIDPFDAWIAV